MEEGIFGSKDQWWADSSSNPKIDFTHNSSIYHQNGTSKKGGPGANQSPKKPINNAAKSVENKNVMNIKPVNAKVAAVKEKPAQGSLNFGKREKSPKDVEMKSVSPPKK